MYAELFGWHGYADAKPSESIQKHELPGLAVAVVFPYQPRVELIEPPVRQYKEYGRRKKGVRARELAEWLAAEQQNGLTLSGFFLAETQLAAATFGLDLIEELPETRVESYYAAYRLFFGEDHIDFAQAVALEYYFLAISFGILNTGLMLKEDKRRLFIAMNRFPGEDTNESVPGKEVPRTPGARFVEFVRNRSGTALGFEENNKSRNLASHLGTLDWWRRSKMSDWQSGKSHPHFVLPDWLAAAAIAHSFRDEFVTSFPKAKEGIDAADGLEHLYSAFTKFNFLSMVGDSNVLSHLRAEGKQWRVPDEARDFVLARAER